MTPRDELRELLRPEREDDLRGLLADVVADTIDDPAPDAIDTLVALLRELGARVPSLPVGGGDGRHLLKISIDDGVAHSELICPERGCVGSSTCGQCGRDVDDTEAEPCYDCPDRPSPCWLQTWAENEDLTSYTADQPLGVFAIDATYDDELIVTILGPASSSAGDEAREALERARASVQDASEMQCRCTGYYRCLGCEREVAEAAGEALEDIDAALAALSSPLPGAGDGETHPITEHGTTRCPNNGGIAAYIDDGECSSCGEPVPAPADEKETTR